MTIAHNDAAIVYSPWNWHIDGSRALSNNAGAYFKVMLIGTPTAVSLTFDVSSMAAVASKIAYRVDCTGWQIVNVAASVTVTLPSYTAAWAKRTLEVRIHSTSESYDRWSSPHATAVKFTGITTTPGSVTAVAPVVMQLRGVYYGDSITEGINTVGTSGDSTVRSDSTLSYASLTADLLGAEIGVIGFGRQGIIRTGNGSVPNLQDAYALQAAGLARSFSTPVDFIAINHGTNDNGVSTPGDFITGYTAFLNSLMGVAAYPTKIIVMVPFNGAYGVSVYRTIIAATNDPTRIRLLDTSGWWASGDGLDAVHPGGWANWSKLAPNTARQIRTMLDSGRTYVKRAGEWVAS